MRTEGGGTELNIWYVEGLRLEDVGAMVLRDKERREPGWGWTLGVAEGWTETARLKRVIGYISASEGRQDAAVRAAMVAEIARTRPKTVRGWAGRAGAEMRGLLAELAALG